MRLLLLLPVIATLGCNNEDGDKLIRVGKITAEKVREATPAKTPLRDLAPDATTVAKVRSRIRNDVYFANVQLEVADEEDGIHLRGTVPSKQHADLAEQLAKQTVGVTKVVNELQWK